MKLVALGLAAIAAVALSAGTSSAQFVVPGGYSGYNRGVVVSPGYGGYNYGRPAWNVGYGSSFYNPGYGNFYPRGHYHYIPGHFDAHRGHYHYHPGHYDYHVPGTPRPRH